MACRRISFVICYMAFKTKISFKKHMKRVAHLLAPLPDDVEGVGGWEGNNIVAGWDQYGGNKAHKRERVHPVMSVTRLSRL